MSYGKCTVVYEGAPCAGSSRHHEITPVKFLGSEVHYFSNGETLYHWQANHPRLGRDRSFWYCKECHIDLMYKKLLRDLKEARLE